MMQGELFERDAQGWKYSVGHSKGASRFESVLEEAVDQYFENGRFEEITRSPLSLKTFIQGQYASFADWCDSYGMGIEK